MNLNLIAQALGCAKSTASMLLNGKYPAKQSDLPRQFAALKQLTAQNNQNYDALCAACPRQDCSGCRISDLTQYD